MSSLGAVLGMRRWTLVVAAALFVGVFAVQSTLAQRESVPDAAPTSSTYARYHTLSEAASREVFDFPLLSPAVPQDFHIQGVVVERNEALGTGRQLQRVDMSLADGKGGFIEFLQANVEITPFDDNGAVAGASEVRSSVASGVEFVVISGTNVEGTPVARVFWWENGATYRLAQVGVRGEELLELAVRTVEGT